MPTAGREGRSSSVSSVWREGVALALEYVDVFDEELVRSLDSIRARLRKLTR